MRLAGTVGAGVDVPFLSARSLCRICHLGWLSAAVGQLDVRGVARTCCMNLVYRREAAAEHPLGLFPELLVQQSVNIRIDSSIEQDHCVGDGDWDGTNVIRCSKHQGVDNLTKAPTDSKYDTDSHDHQGDTLPYLEDALSSDK